MAEYTPSADQVKADWISFMITPGDYWDAMEEPEAEARWDRMIAQVRRGAAAEQREKDARIARDVADKLANGGLIEHGDGAYDAAAAIHEAGINKEEGTK